MTYEAVAIAEDDNNLWVVLLRDLVTDKLGFVHLNEGAAMLVERELGLAAEVGTEVRVLIPEGSAM